MDPHQRKAYASDFVRRYSADVAADLPDNELAQFLNENERRTVMLEEETEAGKVVGFSQWLFADSSDRSGAQTSTEHSRHANARYLQV